jgi:hypothetical protein
LAGYYRKFVRHFGVIAKPLIELLKKHTLYVWTSTHDKAFATLKAALCQAPVLQLPNFSKTFSIETDASGVGVCAVLIRMVILWPSSVKLLVQNLKASQHMRRNT